MTSSARDPRVVVEREGAVTTIRMKDGSRHNQFDQSNLAALTAAVEEAGADQATRVVLLAGAPHSFCVGMGPEILHTDARDRLLRWTNLLLAVLDCPVPTVAAAQGTALGGGLLLALSCDTRILSERSRYAANFLVHGFTPLGGRLIPLVLGGALGTEMILTGRTYPGAELARRGAGLAVVPHEQVDAEAGRTAVRIAQAPRRTLELMKLQLVGGFRAEVKDLLAQEITDHVETVASGESRRRLDMLSDSAGQEKRDQ